MEPRLTFIHQAVNSKWANGARQGLRFAFFKKWSPSAIITQWNEATSSPLDCVYFSKWKRQGFFFFYSIFYSKFLSLSLLCSSIPFALWIRFHIWWFSAQMLVIAWIQCNPSFSLMGSTSTWIWFTVQHRYGYFWKTHSGLGSVLPLLIERNPERFGPVKVFVWRRLHKFHETNHEVPIKLDFLIQFLMVISIRYRSNLIMDITAETWSLYHRFFFKFSRGKELRNETLWTRRSDFGHAPHCIIMQINMDFCMLLDW